MGNKAAGRIWIQVYNHSLSASVLDPREVHDSGRPVYEYIRADKVTALIAEERRRVWVEATLAALKFGKDCPNCPNRGYTVRQTDEHGNCEPEQCEYCECEPLSKFKIKNAMESAAAAEGEIDGA